MKKGISISIEWCDEDVVIFVFSASNEVFYGAVEVYLHHDALEQLANNLSGFPRHAKDQREIDLGAFSMRDAGGGVRMRFVCVDAACHPAVDVKLQNEECSPFGEMQSVVLRIPLEAAAIDNFVTQLRQFKTANGETINLPMAQ